jgi:hypothetical protein
VACRRSWARAASCRSGPPPNCRCCPSSATRMRGGAQAGWLPARHGRCGGQTGGLQKEAEFERPCSCAGRVRGCGVSVNAPTLGEAVGFGPEPAFAPSRNAVTRSPVAVIRRARTTWRSEVGFGQCGRSPRLRVSCPSVPPRRDDLGVRPSDQVTNERSPRTWDGVWSANSSYEGCVNSLPHTSRRHRS